MDGLMAGELELCAAAFFRTIGKDVATPDEFVMEVSLGQKWMSPTEAKTLLGIMTRSKVLEDKGGYLRPASDLSGIDVPLAYRPSKDILNVAPEKKADPPADVFSQLMDVAVARGIQRREFIQECNRIQKRLDIDIGAAALIVIRDSGADIAPYVRMVYDGVKVTPS